MTLKCGQYFSAKAYGAYLKTNPKSSNKLHHAHPAPKALTALRKAFSSFLNIKIILFFYKEMKNRLFEDGKFVSSVMCKLM